jgi:hypothetical protein
MIGEKDNQNIFKQYTKVILEQVNGDQIESLLNKVKSSSLDPQTKYELVEFLNKSNNPQQNKSGNLEGFDRYNKAIWDKKIEDLKKPNDENSEYDALGRKIDWQTTKKGSDYIDMMRDPSKRPRVQTDKAEALEKEYEKKINDLKEKYKNVQREQYSPAVESKYTWSRDKNNEYFYGMLDWMKQGDARQWQKMANGDTSNGLYNDVETVGHPELNYEIQAKDTMRKILELDDAYLSGNKRKLYHLLGLTNPDDGSYLDGSV